MDVNPHSAYHSADSIPPGGEDGIRTSPVAEV